MIKAVLIDDEPLARSIIREYLIPHTGIQVVQECNNGFEGFKAIMHHQPDIIFLDIQMPKINGFEMLELIEKPPVVIFTTAFDEYAIRAFEAHAIDYLLKPYSQERFDKAVAKALLSAASPVATPMPDPAALSPNQSQRIVVKAAGKIKIIPIQDVLYLEAADDFVKIHTSSGPFLKNKTMNHFEQVLDPNLFVRIHRSYLVNVQQITRLEPYEKDSQVAILRSGVQLPVSRQGYAKLRSVLGV